MSKRVFIILSALILIADLSPAQGFFGSGRNRNSGQGSQELTATAGLSTKFRYITVGGRLNPARRLDHSVSVDGIVGKIYHREGDLVTAGEPLMIINRESAGETYRPNIVESRISGKISEIYLKEKAEVRAGTIAVTVIDTGNFIMTASVSDKDAFQLAQLKINEITADSVDNGSINGRMLSLSAEPDYNTGLFTITFEFPAQKGARIGMVLFVDLPVRRYQGVFVSQDVIERRFGKNYIWLVNEDETLKLAAVELGEVFDTEVELKSGVAAGDRYLQRLSGNERDGMSLTQLGLPGGN